MTSENDFDREPVDDALARVLPPAAAQALREWAVQSGYAYELSRFYPNGRSGAIVCAVLEHHRFGPTHKIILKLDRIRDADRRHGEHLRQEQAVHESPTFARRHLVLPVREPARATDELWFTFQKLATGSPTEVGLSDLDVLATLFDEARTGGSPDLFADTAAGIVRSVLTEWASPQTANMTVPEFLGRHLLHRLDPGQELHPLSLAWPDPTIVVPGEALPLANPLRLAVDPAMTGRRQIRAVLGKAHGDLHMENVLVQVRPTVSVADYRLIDLMKYRAHAPLTSDPVYLVLHAVARSLGGLSPQARESLLELLLRPAAGFDATLPAWLGRLVVNVHAAAEDCAGSLIEEWREQTRLSLLAYALILTGRPSTRREDRDWFLRLAARAAQAHLFPDARQEGAAGRSVAVETSVTRSVVPTPPVGTTTGHSSVPAIRATGQPGPAPAPQPAPGASPADQPDWRALLCVHLAELREAATGPSSEQRLAALITAAATGPSPQDGVWAAELEALMTDLLDHRTRAVLPGLMAGTPLLHELYSCPIGRCRRTAGRGRAGEPPTCGLTGRFMRVQAG